MDRRFSRESFLQEDRGFLRVLAYVGTHGIVSTSLPLDRSGYDVQGRLRQLCVQKRDTLCKAGRIDINSEGGRIRLEGKWTRRRPVVKSGGLY